MQAGTQEQDGQGQLAREAGNERSFHKDYGFAEMQSRIDPAVQPRIQIFLLLGARLGLAMGPRTFGITVALGLARFFRRRVFFAFGAGIAVFRGSLVLLVLICLLLGRLVALVEQGVFLGSAGSVAVPGSSRIGIGILAATF